MRFLNATFYIFNFNFNFHLLIINQRKMSKFKKNCKQNMCSEQLYLKMKNEEFKGELIVNLNLFLPF